MCESGALFARARRCRNSRSATRLRPARDGGWRRHLEAVLLVDMKGNVSSMSEETLCRAKQLLLPTLDGALVTPTELGAAIVRANELCEWPVAPSSAVFVRPPGRLVGRKCSNVAAAAAVAVVQPKTTIKIIS